VQDDVVDRMEEKRFSLMDSGAAIQCQGETVVRRILGEIETSTPTTPSQSCPWWNIFFYLIDA
jgi:hypothetical protein